MKFRRLCSLILLIILVACNSTPIAEPQVSASATPAPASLTNTPIPTELPPTGIPSPTQTTIPQLSARSTFEVIAAMHANVLIVEEWSAREFSPAERQAVLQPIIELGVLPLGFLFDQFTPDPLLADEWQAAADVYHAFLPGELDWSENGALQALLDEIAPTSAGMIDQAISAAQAGGVDTTQYEPDFSGAVSAANALLPKLTVGPLPETPAPGKLNLELLPVQITPFVFDYASSEVFCTIGTIENTSTTPQKNVTIEVAYYNFLDEPLGTVRGRLLVDVAISGEMYPFIATNLISGEETALKDWTRYEVAVYSTPAESQSYQAFALEITSTNEYAGDHTLLGQLTNTGDQTINPQQIRISVAAYDVAGILVGVGEGAFHGEGTLAPNDTASFDAIIQAVSAEPASYKFFAELVE